MSTDGTNYDAGDLPNRFGLTTAMSDSIAITLDHTLSNAVTAQIAGQDARMVSGNRTRYLAAPGFNFYNTIGGDDFTADTAASYPISSTPLTGTLSGGSYLFDLSLGDSSGELVQGISFYPVSSSTATLQGELLPVPEASGYQLSATAQVPGSTFDVLQDEDALGETFVWIGSYQNTDATELYIDIWSVENQALTAPITVPALPGGFDAWPAGIPAEGSTETIVDLLGTYAPAADGNWDRLSGRTLSVTTDEARWFNQLQSEARRLQLERTGQAPLRIPAR